MNATQYNDETVFLLYDGECPFCRKAAQYSALKKVYPTLVLVSFRDASETAKIKLPPTINPNDGMTFIVPGKSPLQGVDAFIEINNALGKSGRLFHRFLSIRWVALITYPCLMEMRKITLFMKGIPMQIPKNDF